MDYRVTGYTQNEKQSHCAHMSNKVVSVKELTLKKLEKIKYLPNWRDCSDL
jgi:DNA-binding XRE family transcriptional regulator